MMTSQHDVRFGPIADKGGRGRIVRFVPIGDMSLQIELGRITSSGRAQTCECGVQARGRHNH